VIAAGWLCKIDELIITKGYLFMKCNTGWIGFFIGGWVGLGGAVSPCLSGEKPNIIFILADDVSARELSTYGGRIPMPHLDRMAERGIVFNTAWSAPLCGPSRAMLMTGKYPHNQGYWENEVMPSVPYFRDARHLPLLRMMKQAGYATGWFGKIQHGGPSMMNEIGADTSLIYRYWDGYDGPDQGRDGSSRSGMYGISWYWHPGLIADGKGLATMPADFGPDLELRYLLKFAEANRERPFFAYWPSNLPHKAYDPETKEWYYTDVPEIGPDGTPTGGKVPGSLESTMRYFDHMLGQLNRRLEEVGLADNTIIFFTADNGTADADKGRYDMDVAMRVAFVVSGGPVISRGLTGTLIDFTDIWPTMADLGGYAGERNTDGHSFAPLLLGQPFTARGYCRMAMNNARWIRTANWLLDGTGRFYNVQGARSREDYRDVTNSGDPDVIAARARLQMNLDENLPLPDYNDPLTARAWDGFRKRGHAEVKVLSP
jgi:arylsulfatase A